MDKLNMQTKNMANENYEKLAALFPNAVTETIDENGEVVRAIDKDVLMQEISVKVVEGREERYQFTWPDKKKAIIAANAPTNATLRPCREESVDFDNTENLYIEGDNLEVLKLLQETYLGKVKMIYIDPPYNTGNDFVYEDDSTISIDEYVANSGQFDEQGNRLFHNMETNGRFHTDWLNMIYPRLKIAKNLLSSDGVIFISIDDNEVENLTKVCDEIFGEKNRIALICHKSRASISNDKIISPNHNTILFYSKEISEVESRRKMIGLDPVLDGFDYDDNDSKGEYRLVPVDGPGGAKKGNPFYEFLGVEGYWRFSKETMQEKYNNGDVVKRGNSLYQKYYKSTALTTRRTATTWWDDAGLMSTATAKLKQLMGAATFDTPKPIELITKMLKMMTYTDREAIILDFFSGSATTAHAVMQLNAEDGGNRKFIMVQLPEITYDGKKEKYKDENGEDRERYIIDTSTGYPEIAKDSEARKAGYYTIPQIGKERIRRAAMKIAEENPDAKFDGGFRVLKLDSSNMKDVYYEPSQYKEDLFKILEDNIKDDRTPEDLLFQVMLDLGVLLSSNIVETEMGGKRVFNVEDNYLIACFDKNVTDETITAIAEQKPYYFVMRNSSLANDSVAANFEQIFATYSPGTVRKVL